MNLEGCAGELVGRPSWASGAAACLRWEMAEAVRAIWDRQIRRRSNGWSSSPSSRRGRNPSMARRVRGRRTSGRRDEAMGANDGAHDEESNEGQETGGGGQR